MSAAYDAQAIAAMPSIHRESSPAHAEHARAHCHRGAPSGHEPGTEDEWSSVPVEPLFRPRVSLLPLLAPEHQPRNRRFELPAQQVGSVVSGEGAHGAGGDDEREHEVTRPSQDSRRDDGGLAGDDRDDRVEIGDRDDDQVRPVRGRDEVYEGVEHSSSFNGRAFLIRPLLSPSCSCNRRLHILLSCATTGCTL